MTRDATLLPKPNGPRRTAHSRRRFFRKSAGTAITGGFLTAVVGGYLSLRTAGDAPAKARAPLGILRPPGALGENDFLASCIRCTRCADACEVNCIQLFGSEAGSLQGTPCIVPIARGCTLCLKCGEACPTGAIVPLVNKEDADMGEAVVDDRLCVSTNGTGICGACYTACPLSETAITQEIRNAPKIHPEFCTGCGLCEEFCIVDERDGLRAIQVVTKRAWPYKKEAA